MSLIEEATSVNNNMVLDWEHYLKTSGKLIWECLWLVTSFSHQGGLELDHFNIRAVSILFIVFQARENHCNSKEVLGLEHHFYTIVLLGWEHNFNNRLAVGWENHLKTRAVQGWESYFNSKAVLDCKHHFSTKVLLGWEHHFNNRAIRGREHHFNTMVVPGWNMIWTPGWF